MSQEKIFQFRRRFDSLYWQQFLLTAGMVLLTLLLLVFFSKSNRAPRALGEIYDKGKR